MRNHRLDHRLTREQVIPRAIEDVFPFFADAANLERLTPGFLHFRILTSLPIAMRAGVLIDYRLRLYGVPIRWRTRIEEFEPGTRFTDVQLEGPYRFWRHAHEFTSVPGGTLMRDVVEYALPLGPLGEIAHVLFVRRSLEAIFDYRAEVVAELFPACAPTDPGARS